MEVCSALLLRLAEGFTTEGHGWADFINGWFIEVVLP